MTSFPVVVIGCSGQKGTEPAPAVDLYTGSYFHQAERAARSDGRPFLVLSARYGLLHPEEVIEPYDHFVPARHLGGVEALTALLRAQRASRPDLPHAVESWCSASYSTALARAGYLVATPLTGMRIGARRHWLYTRTDPAYLTRAPRRTS